MADKFDRRAFLSGAGKAALGTAAAAAVIQVGAGEVGTVEQAPLPDLMTHKRPDSLPILAFRKIPHGSEISVYTLDDQKVPFFAQKVGADGVELALQGAGSFSVGFRSGKFGEKRWQRIECELGQYIVVDTSMPVATTKGMVS